MQIFVNVYIFKWKLSACLCAHTHENVGVWTSVDHYKILQLRVSSNFICLLAFLGPQWPNFINFAIFFCKFLYRCNICVFIWLYHWGRMPVDLYEILQLFVSSNARFSRATLAKFVKFYGNFFLYFISNILISHDCFTLKYSPQDGISY